MIAPSCACKVLIVEDDPDLRELLRWHLTKEGFVVSTSDEGFDAIRCFSRERPDVVLLDIMLPGADGWRVCQQIRSVEGASSRTRIIMVSARTEEGDVLRGLDLGADDYVRKPF